MALSELADAEEDQKIANLVNSFNVEQRHFFSSNTVKDLPHYSRIQQKWLMDQIWFLGIRLGRAPSEGEIAEEILNSDVAEKFRCFYVIKYKLY